MTADRASPRLVQTDARDAKKPAKLFFAEMPWDGETAFDPSEWSAGRLLELVCNVGADEG